MAVQGDERRWKAVEGMVEGMVEAAHLMRSVAAGEGVIRSDA